MRGLTLPISSRTMSVPAGFPTENEASLPHAAVRGKTDGGFLKMEKSQVENKSGSFVMRSSTR